MYYTLSHLTWVEERGKLWFWPHTCLFLSGCVREAYKQVLHIWFLLACVEVFLRIFSPPAYVVIHSAGTVHNVEDQWGRHLNFSFAMWKFFLSYWRTRLIGVHAEELVSPPSWAPPSFLPPSSMAVCWCSEPCYNITIACCAWGNRPYRGPTGNKHLPCSPMLYSGTFYVAY